MEVSRHLTTILTQQVSHHLRLTHGICSNQQVPLIGWYQKYPSSLGNDELSWETTTQTNIGFDARFLNDKVSLSADYFNKQTEDLLVSGITPSYIIGGTASPLNAGSVLNSGFEFEGGYRDKIGQFSYSVSANLSTLHNEVTYLHPALTYIAGASLHLDRITIFEEGAEVWHFSGI